MYFDYSEILIHILNPDQGCTSLTMAMLSCWKLGEPGPMSQRRVRLGLASPPLWKMPALNFHSSFVLNKSLTSPHLFFLQAEGSTLFRYPSYVQDIMGDIFSLGFGPFRCPFVGNFKQTFQWFLLIGGLAHHHHNHIPPWYDKMQLGGFAHPADQKISPQPTASPERFLSSRW